MTSGNFWMYCGVVRYQVDQSGKIEQTEKITVLAAINGDIKVVILPAKEKRRFKDISKLAIKIAGGYLNSTTLRENRYSVPASKHTLSKFNKIIKWRFYSAKI